MAFEFLNNLKNEIINMDNEVYEDLEIEEYISEEKASALLTFYGRCQLLRDEKKEETIKIFNNAFNEDPIKAMKILFYIRDKYNGLGERSTFKIIINYLGRTNNKYLRENIDLIPVYGRWDDLYALFNTKLEDEVIRLFKEQIQKDLNSDKPSTLCKWLKSENATSETTRQLAKRTRILLNLSSKEYRHLLTKLRSKAETIETYISRGRWGDIQYGNLSAANLKKYHKTFMRHDKDRYSAFLNLNIAKKRNEDLHLNSTKIVDKYFPYNILERIVNNKIDYTSTDYKEIWSKLPDYLEDQEGDTLACIGLMGETMKKIKKSPAFYASVSTALYLLENNKGRYKDYIVTMKPTPNFKRVKGTDIFSRIEEIITYSLNEEVNVESALDLILFAAIKHNISSSDIPKRLFFITDGKCNISLLSIKGDKQTPYFINAEEYENIKEKWSLAGYTIPALTFWIIDGVRENSNVIMDNNSFIIASGYSHNVFISILKDEYTSTEDLMNIMFNDNRYSNIKIPKKD
ncbi:DUF2828 family protein [Clostridium paraputrificum]|uniref:DUF2828 family protein n=1 Tax=Clostridium TaxID=1485 RepID=UPI003D33C886